MFVKNIIPQIQGTLQDSTGIFWVFTTNQEDTRTF